MARARGSAAAGTMAVVKAGRLASNGVIQCTTKAGSCEGLFSHFLSPCIQTQLNCTSKGEFHKFRSEQWIVLVWAQAWPHWDSDLDPYGAAQVWGRKPGSTGSGPGTYILKPNPTLVDVPEVLVFSVARTGIRNKISLFATPRG